MTRKDFNLIAQAIRDARSAFPGSDALTLLTQLLAQRLATINPAFNHARFLDACQPKE